MERLTVTRDIAIRCILFGACKIPKVGTPASEFSASDLFWAEHIFNKKELLKFGKPLWTFSGSGYGDGSGSGSGKDIASLIAAVGPEV